MKTSRRDFLITGAEVMAGLPLFASYAYGKNENDSKIPERTDPGRYLVREAIKISQKKKKNNVPPVLREEILENKNAVFIIRTDVHSEKMSSGKYPVENEQMETTGFETAGKMFRKGNSNGGTTYIKPNYVHFFPKDGENINNGISTHPAFVAGFCDAMKELGNTNIIVGANGGAAHEHFVNAGVCDMMREHDICFLEGKYESFHDYKKSELTWVDFPDGVVMRKIPFFNPIKEKDTTFINMAKDRIHNLAVTTLTIKNLQGIMPVGYMHVCNGWVNGLEKPASLQPNVEVFNPDYQKIIEKLYIKHANMGYKYWDEAGLAKKYFDAGGWEAYRKGEFSPEFLTFREEIWSQRILDIASNINPYVNMVEGVFGIDILNNLYLNNFITVSRSMVACDAVTTWLMGHDPRELFYLRTAHERGMGENDIEKIPIYEISGKGIERVNDYRKLPRARMGVIMHHLKGGKLRYF